jgi:glutamate N-acetyltransferase/amino-acid N-acetyltransferase
MTGGSGVTAAEGFRASGGAAGLKGSGARDVAIVANDGPEFAATAVATTNRVKAAPVQWTERVVRDGAIRAVVLNSGGANACTGRRGHDDTETTASLVAELLDCEPAQVAVCSTGLIGATLPMELLLAGVRTAAKELSVDGHEDAALAILTTDTTTKTAQTALAGVTIGGMAKGAGMLAPALATMLVVITTDAQVAPATLDAALRAATSVTFDRIDSDGCMSTNDTVVLMASGASGVMVGRDLPEPQFTAALTQVCHSLAQQLLADAEGASKQIEIVVSRAASEADALAVARAIARSNLFKCAIHGEDPNWGRVLAAVGTTTANFDPDQITVHMNGTTVCVHGAALGEEPTVDLTGDHVVVQVELGAGADTAKVWTNDLTAAYVHENSAYST